MRIEIKADQAQIAKINLLMGEIKNGVPKVMVRAINKSLVGVQSDAVKAIAVDLNLTQERIRQDFYINTATWENITGSVVAKGEPVNFASFSGTTQSARGTSVKLKKSGTRTMFKHVFIWSRFNNPGASINPVSGAVSGTQSLTAFERDWHEFHTKASPQLPWKKFGWKYRLPLETKTGPRIEDEFAKDRVIKSVEIEAKGRIDTNMAHELDYELSKLSK